MNNVENQISRMKAMMSYGLQTENKKNSYYTVEHEREGADGKMYGIVREGAKFYIKVASKKNGKVLAESYDYIGGFMNRKNHEYTSYAKALKQFELKMASVKESVGNKAIIIESWNPERKEELAVEATEKMRREIMRQRQIMGNATVIAEKKNYTVDLTEACEKVNKECAATQKNNIKNCKDGKGEPVGNGGDPYTEKVDAEQKSTQTTNTKKEFKPVMESEQVLGWNENDDYLDTTHGTEIGDTAPYTEGENADKSMNNGVVEEGTVMHNTENQNSPEVGTNEIGDDDPYTEKVNEDFEVDDTDVEANDIDFEGDDELAIDGEFDVEEPVGVDAEFDAEVEPIEDEESNMEERISAIEDLLNRIADALDVNKYEDEPLYDDEEEEGTDANPIDDASGEAADDEDDDVQVYESAAAKRVMAEDKLDYFGKHPAYQKSPMELPSNKHNEYPGNYDMNDDSVQSEEPYGKEIGDSAPFEIDPQAIENAITESIKNILKKKI